MSLLATFLTTPKMSPELAARVEASVRGRTVAQGRRKPGLVIAARLAVVSVAVALVVALSVSWQRRDSAKERARAELLAAIEREAATLEPQHHQLVTRVEALLIEAAGAEHEAGAIAPAALDQLLTRPTIYVRGEHAAFGDPARMREAVRASLKDTFVLCLVEPPAARTETALLAQVRVAYSGGLEKRTRHVHRLQSAAEVLPLLGSEWVKRVEEASSLIELGELRTTFDRANFERGKAAAAADLLIYVLDEPPAAGARVELDGASKHDARVGIVDIPSGKPLMRLRAQLDPAWISEDNRLQLAGALDGCRLALDVRARAMPPAK
jgi:hypothetical protein